MERLYTDEISNSIESDGWKLRPRPNPVRVSLGKNRGGNPVDRAGNLGVSNTTRRQVDGWKSRAFMVYVGAAGEGALLVSAAH